MSLNSTHGTATITVASTGIGALYADRLARQLADDSGRTVEVIPADLNQRAARYRPGR